VNEAGIKLTTYFDDRARVDGGFLADALCDLYGRHEIHTSVLLRGVEGFGAHHPLQSDRLLSLSESLPAVSIAIDSRERVERALPDVLRTATHGLVSLERAQLITGDDLDRLELPEARDRAVKLTVYGGRSVRSGGRAGYVEAVDVLRDCGVAGASVLLAVDGTLHGERRRARFFARNADVPLMLLAIGDPDSINSALPRVSALLDDPVATIERVQICKADGHTLSAPDPVPEADAAGLPIWHKLMIHAEEQAKVGGHPLYRELVARLREAGAAGATVLKGVRGFYAGRAPVSDRVLSVRRNVPVHVVVVDTPGRMQRWWPLIDQATGEAGLITSELVPASHAVHPGRRPRLTLARTPTAADDAP
jgi:PII-like signaling protein